MPQLTWLITGCSSGFGEQFVHSILARGDQVIATGRNKNKILHLESAGASILDLDITSPQNTLNEIVAKAISIYGKIDVLLNNAAYVSTGTLEDLEYVYFKTTLFGALLTPWRQIRRFLVSIRYKCIRNHQGNTCYPATCPTATSRNDGIHQLSIRLDRRGWNQCILWLKIRTRRYLPFPSLFHISY
jgi:hypothetical protein